jgi:hypothetical protein
MKKASPPEAEDLRPEYVREDLGQGVRGKHLAFFQAGSNLVRLDAEIAQAFPTSESVNQALRKVLELTEQTHALRKPRVRRRSEGPGLVP